MATIQQNFWRRRRVLVTGHTGFKGAWLCLWLSELGAQVRGFSLPRTPDPSLFSLAALDCAVESQLGDLRCAAAIHKSIRDFQPEIVFHMAAQALVRTSYLEPVETFATNVQGTVNLLEAVRVGSSATRAVVVITSDKCYQMPTRGGA